MVVVYGILVAQRAIYEYNRNINNISYEEYQQQNTKKKHI